MKSFILKKSLIKVLMMGMVLVYLWMTPLDTRNSIPLATPYANLFKSFEVSVSPASPPSAGRNVE